MEDENNNFLLQKKERKNLVSRLYKNFNTDRMDQSQPSNINEQSYQNPQTSVLSTARTQKQLIPRIASRRLNPIENKLNLPISINNGKILINNNTTKQSIMPSGQMSPNQLFNQSKILPSFALNEQSQSLNLLGTVNEPSNKNKINLSKIDKNYLSVGAQNMAQETQVQTPRQILSDEINELDPKMLANTNRLKKQLKDKRTHRKNNKKRSQKDVIAGGRQYADDSSQEYLTPLDFIHLIRTDPEMADEFCYLIKCSNPYDFRIVDFVDIRNEYMTISARGITHFVDDEATFMTIEEWEREAKMFHHLQKIQFS